MLADIPWSLLIIAAVLMAFAPFGQTPHLVEKVRMLKEGTLKKPLDIFDLIMHITPIFLIAIKAVGWLIG